MAVCPHCGAALVPPYRFCPACGQAVPAALPYPPPVYHLPPKKDNTALIIVIVALVIVLAPIVMAAVLYAMVSSQLGGPGGGLTPIRGTVTRSANGSYWILTFTSVPSGMTPMGSQLSMTTSASISALAPTSFSSLPGGNVTLSVSLGRLYIAYHGATAGTVTVGDTILIGTSTSTGASTTGYNLQITWNGSFFNTSLQ